MNAGNANCATRTGDQVALATVRAAAKALGVKPEYVLPASTGVIGVEMDGGQDRRMRFPALVAGLDAAHFDAVAGAIMTTDLVPKTAFAEIKSGRKIAHIAGMTKGSGMIQPNMATTLGFVDDRRRGLAGGAARGAEARDRAQLQPHLGGWRHLHQRHGRGAGQRSVGREAHAPKPSRRR